MSKSQKPKILINTSSWINICEIGLHLYMVENFDVHTTPKVVEEIREGEEFAQDAKIFKELLERELIRISPKNDVPDDIRHEISISSEEIELASTAFEYNDFIVLIDDSRVYRVLERTGIKFISSVNIVIDAYLTGTIDRKQAFEMLDKLRISIRNEIIDKAREVIAQWR